MTASEDHFSPAFQSKQSRILEIWDRLQRLQTDFCLPQELSVYYTSDIWRRAASVIDLGTGNGYYLQRIAKLFPEKRYCGLDRSPELVEIADRESKDGDIHYTCCDVSDAAGTFDFAIMRLLMQHLHDIPATLRHVAGLVPPSGAALIVDAYDPFRCYVPELPEFMEFFRAYSNDELSHGRDRSFSDKLPKLVEASGDWKITRTTRLLIPSTVAQNLALFTETYLLLIDLIEAVGELEFNFNHVRRAFREWSKLQGAYTQVGLSMIELARV